MNTDFELPRVPDLNDIHNSGQELAIASRSEPPYADGTPRRHLSPRRVASDNSVRLGSIRPNAEFSIEGKDGPLLGNDHQAHSKVVPAHNRMPRSVDASAAHWKAVRSTLQSSSNIASSAELANGLPAPGSDAIGNTQSDARTILQPWPVDSSSLLRNSYHSRIGVVASTSRLHNPGCTSSGATFDPSDPKVWSRSRVLSWLEENSFGKDWQDTFESQNIEHAQVRTRCANRMLR